MPPPDEPDPEKTVVEVEFTVSNADYPLVALSEETGCKAELVQLLPRSDGAYTGFQRITGAPPERILKFAQDYEGFEARVVSRSETDAIIEFRISGDSDFFTITLTDAGAIPTELASEDGVAHIIAEIPAIYSASEVINQFQDMYPSMDIIARRQKEAPVPFVQHQELQNVVSQLLTPRQHETLLLAYTNGFYDWPRDITGEELADKLDITPSTFHQHLRTAERRILSMIFSS